MMGWWETMKEWGSNLYNNASISTVVGGSGRMVFNTIQGLFKQISVIPEVVVSPFTHDGTRRVASQVARIALEDLLPLVLVGYTNNLIQQHGREYLADDLSADWLSVDTALQTGLLLIQAATMVYSLRKKTQLAVRTTVLTMEASKTLGRSAVHDNMGMCTKQKCSFINLGPIRDVTSYWATEAAISLIGYVPVAGGTIAAILSVHHRGRYILSMALPDLCSEHQVEYLQQYPELALSIGIGHSAMTSMANGLIAYYTGIPSSYYEGIVGQFMLFTSLSAASHCRLPDPLLKSTRSLPDPVAAYQSGIGFVFDTVVLGLKKQIPRLLKQPPSDIPWGTIFDYAKRTWNHPYAKQIEFFAVPRMLRSGDAFIKDPVIQPNWEGLRTTTIHVIKSIEAIKGKVLVQVGTYNPKMASNVLWAAFGTPKAVSKLLLKLMGNNAFMESLCHLRQEMERMRSDDGTGNLPDAPVIELRTDKPLEIAPDPSKSRSFVSAAEQQEIVDTICLSATSTQSNDAAQTIKRTPKPNIDPAALILGGNRGQVSDGASLILGGGAPKRRARPVVELKVIEEVPGLK